MLCFYYTVIISLVTSCFLGHSRPAHLYPLPRRLLVTSEDGPASAVGLDKRQFKLGAQDPELAFFRLDGGEQRQLGLVPLAVAGREIQFDALRLEFDACCGLVDLLEV